MAADASGNRLEGHAVSVQQVPGAGEDGLALRFGAPGAKVDMPPSDRYACGGGGFALTLWVRTRQRQPATILALAEKSGAVRLRLSVAVGGRLQLELWGPLQPALVSRASVADGDWHYVTAVYDAPPGEAFLFVDDAFAHCAPLAPGGPQQVALRLGNDFGADRPFRGDLDDVTLICGIPAEVARVLARYRGWGELADPGPAGPPLPDPRLPATPPQGAELRAALDGLRAEVARWLGPPPEVTSAAEGEAVDLLDLRATPVTIQSQGVQAPAMIVTAAETVSEDDAPHPAVILADPEGKAAVMEGRRDLLGALANAGAVACVVDLSRDAVTAGRQLLAAAAYLRARPDVQPGEVMLVCWDTHAAAGLAAAACDGGIGRAVMLEASGVALAELAAAVAPRPLWLQGSLELRQLTWPIAAYRELAPDALLVSSDPVSAAEVAAWLPPRP